MRKEIKLPNNWIGVSVILIALILVIAVPFVVVFSLLSYIAPYWASIVVAIAASFITFIYCVSFK